MFGTGAAPWQGRKPGRDLARIIMLRSLPHFHLRRCCCMEEIINYLVPLIQNVGFPITCVLGMFYFWNKEREDHKQELKAVTDALANNTLALQRLSDKLTHD